MATKPGKSNIKPASKQDQAISRYSLHSPRARYSMISAALIFGVLAWGELFPLFAAGVFARPIFVVGAIVAIFAFGCLIIFTARFGSTLEIATALLIALSTLVAMFSVLYSNYGTTNNFTTKLTPLDAIYFSVGTLSTAGTGNISAISETARVLQTVQMILDVLLIGFAVSLAVAEISSRMQNKRS